MPSRLENRIKELEDQVAAANAATAAAVAAAAAAAAAHTAAHTTARTKSPASTHPSSNHSSPPSSSFLSNDPVSSSSSTATTTSGSRHHVHADEQSYMNRRFRGLKIDDRGSITYHGATSFFHIPSDNNVVTSPSGPSSVTSAPSPATNATSTSGNKFLPLTEVAVSNRRERLVSNAWHQRALENMTDIPSMGPYYSHTLLNAMLSHSIRFARADPSTRSILDHSYEGGAIFGKHARSMVFDEISRGVVSVTTVQTLLLLSAQECSLANTAQAWTYSGLAFRLVDHLGACVDGERYMGSVPLSDEDLEVRHRLYWSCFFWDKMISLYLGRAPSLQHTAVSPPHVICKISSPPENTPDTEHVPSLLTTSARAVDNSAENDLWMPFGANPAGTWAYPPATAHSTSTFTSTCQLVIIFNEILIHMYDPLFQNTEDEMNECLGSQEAALQSWWDNLPPYLRLDPSSLPGLAPPSHIITLNCLYHTFKILLYRPFLTRSSHPSSRPLIKEEPEAPPVHNYLVQCVTSATSIIAMFNLFSRTFGTNYCVLSLSYSLYIAATIYLLQVQAFPNDQQALMRLDYCLRALGEIKVYTPVIAGALNLIHRELARLGIPLSMATYQPPATAPFADPAPKMAPGGNAFYGTPGAAMSPFDEQPQPQPHGHPQHGPQPGPQLGPQPQPMEYLFQSQAEGVDAFGPDPIAMAPGVFEAMSSLEPLSAWMGTINEYDVPGA
ncbi:Fungal trans [Geosmithia morbida]|uniref:Fungal trans n=1 Tax=Geosmithia morbida TaxID=1094350 RepID=A0A9P4Z050_9HYPO|nr:Fungal trans [Geosmithia morbida]KAF4124972.1 Fungal trans [Geosmithia morbida]